MSYDYLMFHSPGPWPQWIKRIGMIFGSGPRYSLGTAEELMGRVNELFPNVKWQQETRRETMAVASLMAGNRLAPGATMWVGRGRPEFQFGADKEGAVKVLFVSRAEPQEVRSLCRRLSLAYMDMQANGVFGMLFR